MDKDEYREEVLKELREIKFDIGIIRILNLATYILLIFIMIIALFK